MAPMVNPDFSRTRLPLPPGIDDGRFRAFAAAMDQQFGVLRDALPRLLVYRLPGVDASLLPHLAWQFHVMGVEGWDLAVDEQARRELVRDAWELHRFKGTPWAVKHAIASALRLSVEIEEDGREGRWARYQMDSGRVLGRDEVARVLAAAQAWGPARARLRRIYNGYDLRALVLSGRHPLGRAIVGSDSGVELDGVRQSFGLHHGATVVGRPLQDIATARSDGWGGKGLYVDCLRVGAWRLGNRLWGRSGVSTSELHTVFSPGLSFDIGRIVRPSQSIPKAAVLLGASRLGDVNACLGASTVTQVGGPPRLGVARLGGYRYGLVRAPVYERFQPVVAVTVGAGPLAVPGLAATAIHSGSARRDRGWPVLGRPCAARRNLPGARADFAAHHGGPLLAVWPESPWPAVPWADIAPIGRLGTTAEVASLASYDGVATASFAATLTAGLSAAPAGGPGAVVAGALTGHLGGACRPLWSALPWTTHTWTDAAGGIGVKEETA
jgi:hypothetical protein